MGGAIGLAIATSVLNNHVSSGLLGILNAEQIKSLLDSPSVITNLPPNIRDTVQGIFAQGYNIQFKILAGIASAQIPASLIMWQKEQIVV